MHMSRFHRLPYEVQVAIGTVFYLAAIIGGLFALAAAIAGGAR